MQSPRSRHFVRWVGLFDCTDVNFEPLHSKGRSGCSDLNNFRSFLHTGILGVQGRPNIYDEFTLPSEWISITLCLHSGWLCHNWYVRSAFLWVVCTVYSYSWVYSHVTLLQATSVSFSVEDFCGVFFVSWKSQSISMSICLKFQLGPEVPTSK